MKQNTKLFHAQNAMVEEFLYQYRKYIVVFGYSFRWRVSILPEVFATVDALHVIFFIVGSRIFVITQEKLW